MSGLFLIEAKYGKMTYYIQRMLEIRKEYFPNQQVVEQVSRGRKFIDENCREPLELLTISRYSFLSKFHFTRLFKRCYGRTPHQYLTEKRMELAKQLLVSNYSVMDVCYLIGFDSPNSFSALFKKYTGASPRDFKKKQFPKKIRFRRSSVYTAASSTNCLPTAAFLEILSRSD